LYDDRLLKVQKNADALYSSSVLSSNVNAIFGSQEKFEDTKQSIPNLKNTIQ
jgi:hypothetical protein